jgi:hypothetical protein
LFHCQGCAIRLLVGDEEVPFGTGEAHYDAILRVLALCQPTRAGSPVPSAFRKLAERPASAGLALLVLSWPDPAIMSACAGAGRIVWATDCLSET